MFIKIFDLVHYISKSNDEKTNIEWLTYKKIVSEAFDEKNTKLKNRRKLQFNNAWQNFIKNQ